MNDIWAVFHYVPLHDSPAGRRYGRTNGDLIITDDLSARLIRLPMWVGLQEADQDRVVDALTRILTCQRVSEPHRDMRIYQNQ